MKKFEKGVMVFGKSGRVKYVGVIKGMSKNDTYEIFPSVICIEDRCYNLSDSMHEMSSIKGEVTTEDFDLFADIRKTKLMSYIDIMEEEFMLELRRLSV